MPRYKGKTVSQIADMVGRSRPSVYTTISTLGIEPVGTRKVANSIGRRHTTRMYDNAAIERIMQAYGMLPEPAPEPKVDTHKAVEGPLISPTQADRVLQAANAIEDRLNARLDIIEDKLDSLLSKVDIAAGDIMALAKAFE